MISFEPEQTITSASDFTKELIAFKEREGNDLVIVEESMEPVVELNGTRYRCMLDVPRAITSRNPLVTALSYTGPSLGFKHVYFYEI